MRRTLLFFAFTMLINTCATASYRAFCKTAVADVVSFPLGNEATSYEQVKNNYNALPYSWGPSDLDKLACPRIHQLLLHEIVTVLEENEFEARVEISPLVTARDNQTLSTVQGWMLKECLCPLDSDCAEFLPQPINWKSGIINDDDHTVALISPFIDNDNRLYSAGTRFVLAREIGENFYAISFDEGLNNFKEITIPQALCAYQPTLAEYDKRMLFCTLIGLWAEIPDAHIPLVWGGASIGGAYNDEEYYLSDYEINSQVFKVWNRPFYGIVPHMGLDASNMISRAAQLVGIPYFWKNSLTASLMLDEVAMNEYPLSGDLIWMPGSLLVINDAEENSVITTMSYTSGYGSLVKLQLASLFKDIHTFDDLLQARASNQSLTVLNRDGSVARVIEEFKILKLM